MAIHHLYTEIEIEASAERVWAVLVDFASYSQWNPFIRSAVSVPQQGARLQIVIQPSGGKARRVSPVVLAAESWSGCSARAWIEIPSGDSRR